MEESSLCRYLTDGVISQRYPTTTVQDRRTDEAVHCDVSVGIFHPGRSRFQLRRHKSGHILACAGICDPTTARQPGGSSGLTGEVAATRARTFCSAMIRGVIVRVAKLPRLAREVAAGSKGPPDCSDDNAISDRANSRAGVSREVPNSRSIAWVCGVSAKPQFRTGA